MTKRGILYIILFLSVLVLAGLYVMMGYYYAGSFSYGTWINKVYCTGKSIDQVNQELKNSSLYSGILLTEEGGSKYFVDGATIGYEVDYKNELQSLLDNQKPLAWGINLFTSKDRNIVGDICIDEDMLRQSLERWPIFEDSGEAIYEIRRDDENGYYLVNNERNKPIFEVFLNKVSDAIHRKEYELDLSNDPECYIRLTPTDQDMAVKELFEKLDVLQNHNMSISMLDKSISFSGKEMADYAVTLKDMDKAKDEEISEDNPSLGRFIYGDKVGKFPSDYGIDGEFVVDSNGNLIISCSKLYDYYSKKVMEFDTEYDIAAYQKTGRGTIFVSGNKDGQFFDKDKEFESFLEAFATGENDDLVVEAPAKSFEIDAKELGNEYIIIDMGKQHLSYYKDGKLTLEYDVVTGNTGLGRSTPVGFFHVYNKRYHTILRGADYASYVNYWLGVNKGVGIHDATWRREFGGEIYKHSGSHGCINSPLEKMEILYNSVEVGVPVLLFY
ncbi:L,D-transpeptidase [Butyrivibrio sp. WCD3002]|uniref:L,D-transpeptidase n=1 Tax=Butyrivibrio sp. WCD3002 TaxID=1280676 RepID=UPI000414640E|nr:L,D-transpeptidase [Butyrivibrio sp. WCD3002]